MWNYQVIIEGWDQSLKVLFSWEQERGSWSMIWNSIDGLPLWLPSKATYLWQLADPLSFSWCETLCYIGVRIRGSVSHSKWTPTPMTWVYWHSLQISFQHWEKPDRWAPLYGDTGRSSRFTWGRRKLLTSSCSTSGSSLLGSWLEGEKLQLLLVLSSKGLSLGMFQLWLEGPGADALKLSYGPLI